MKPKADVLDADDWLTLPVGSASALYPVPGARHIPREFPPGFHGAAPGPSHDETPKRRATRQK